MLGASGDRYFPGVLQLISFLFKIPSDIELQNNLLVDPVTSGIRCL